MADPAKMSISDFAQKIKAKYPGTYDHMNDQELANRVMMKFPQYREHVNLVSQAPVEQSFGDKLTAGGSSAGAQAFDAKHPILGKPLRALDAAGGAVMGLPGFLYHSVADPLSPEEQARGQNRYEAVPERLLGAEQTASALHDYGAGKVSPKAAMSVLPEALGTGVGTVGATEGLGQAIKGTSKLADYGSNSIASKMRYPATESQAAIGKPGSVKPLPFTPDWLSEGLVPKGRRGSLTNPGPPPNAPYSGEKQGLPYQPDPHYGEYPPPAQPLPPRTGPLLLRGNVEPPLGSIENPGIHSKIPLRVPKSVLDAERLAAQPAPATPEIGTPENPGPMAKLPMRVPREVLNEEAEAQAASRGAETNRDATLVKANIPPYAGEGPMEESPITSESQLSQYGAPRPRGRMGPPMRPVVGTPEDWQTFDNQMGIIKPEAQTSGMYHAARGAVGRIPDLQERIGGKLRPFGRPVDLQEDVVPPPRKVSSDE